MGVRTLILLAAVPALLPAQDLKAEHRRILDALNAKDASGKVMALDDPRVPDLVRRGWSLSGQWAAAYLDRNPHPAKRDLDRIFEGFAPAPRGVKSPYGDFLEYGEYSLRGSAMRIGPSVYVVEASYAVDFPTSTFMVVAKNRAGHFEVLWDIKTLAERHYGEGDELGRWIHLTRRAYDNGPLVVRKVLPAARASNGHLRFLVDAWEAADGGTHLGQLSVWEWNGRTARPLLVKTYQFGADYYRFRVRGNRIRIATKEELGILRSCGMCAEPEGFWTVRITARGVRDLGHRLVAPELQWVDDLLTKPTTTLATRPVVNQLRAYEASDPAFSWGMLGEYRVRKRTITLQTDPGVLHLRFVRRNGRPYFTGVRIASS